MDAEPNPIRDTHEGQSSSMFHYSPSSASPDEEEGHSDAQCSRERSTHASECVDLTLVRDSLESVPESSREDCREDVATVASSDIVVIRNVDAWYVKIVCLGNVFLCFRSLASGSNRRPESDQHSVVAAVTSNNQMELRDDQLEEISTLKAKLKHRDQKVAELALQNEKLKTQNAHLSQRNKSVYNK